MGAGAEEQKEELMCPTEQHRKGKTIKLTKKLRTESKIQA